MHRSAVVRDAVIRSAGRHRALVRCLVALMAAVGPGATLDAQSTDFLLSTAPISFPTPRLEQFTSWPPSASGPVTDSVVVPFTVDRRNNLTIRVTTVLVRCTGTTGGKPCSDIEWRSGPSSAWRPLSLVDQEVESRTVIPILLNDPWSGEVWFRVRVSWDDPAPSTMTSGIALTLSVFRP